MENINTIATLVSSVGFPIVMCFILFKYIQSEMADMRKVIEKNTEAIISFTKMVGDKDV